MATAAGNHRKYTYWRSVCMQLVKMVICNSHQSCIRSGITRKYTYMSPLHHKRFNLIGWSLLGQFWVDCGPPIGLGLCHPALGHQLGLISPQVHQGSAPGLKFAILHTSSDACFRFRNRNRFNQSHFCWNRNQQNQSGLIWYKIAWLRNYTPSCSWDDEADCQKKCCMLDVSVNVCEVYI